jgi:hypothetical protein
MAGQDDTCWKCGATWDDLPAPPTLERARQDADRRTHEGGRAEWFRRAASAN